MQGVDVFCERCGTLQPRPEANTPRSAGVLARRVLDAVGLTESQGRPVEDWLRLCLTCRGYSCPTCWNEAEGACQTCAPLPEPVVTTVVEAEPEAPPLPLDVLPAYVEPYAPEPVFYAQAPEPVYVVAEPEPEPVVVAEPEPEPVVVAEPEPEPAPEPVTRPAPPRMPVLPLPPPRPANAPAIPLPTHPVLPQIAFNLQVDAAASRAAAAPDYQPHVLLAPPPSTPQAGPGGLRPCANCQLSLSPRAHFCRRCGTPQLH